ncbi:hypothetical protein LTR37_003281 [Vermiconidia calcicola]|uniref:Uncharacterized protein n=1 Tax=Vermiconidia calcicola TaxID=1690605 RepID=A0ACC3NQB3_9PEZI|nr:hypothetical protein LTR37_003281 [Vermiconidia calcicola]
MSELLGLFMWRYTLCGSASLLGSPENVRSCSVSAALSEKFRHLQFNNFTTSNKQDSKRTSRHRTENRKQTTRSHITMQDFQYLFDGLPAELRLIIEDFTFSAGPTIQRINIDYKPPSAFQVSTDTRQKFATSYYRDTAFTITKQAPLRKWLSTLKPEHREQIKTVHYNIVEAAEEDGPERLKTHPTKKLSTRQKKAAKKGKRIQKRNNDDNFASHKRASAKRFFVQSFLGKRKLRLRTEVLQVNMRFDGMEEDIWTHQPEVVFKEWKRGRQKDGEVPVVSIARDEGVKTYSTVRGVDGSDFLFS